MHTYRTHASLLVGLLAFTVVVQAIRVLPIWLVGKSVGIDLSPRPYYVMGPILFVVLLAPFTINGLAVREAFFVSFLGNLGVAAEPAFAAGFLFFLVTVLMAVPGALILGLGGASAVPDVSTIVVTYNAMPWVEQALESVPGTELVVVDHGSTDGTLELVRERFPEAIVVEQENKGFGAGNNAGMRAASGRWYLLLNSDAWLEPGALDALVGFARGAPGRGGRRPAPAQPGPHAAALGARLPERVADRDRVPVPAQARAPLARAERLLRGRLRPRRRRARRSS